MLRTKQISNLSNCARAILYSGSRCNAPDGGSCSCTDDEKCASRRHTTLLQKTLGVGSKDTARAYNKPNSINRSTSHSQFLGKSSDCVSYAACTDTEETDVTQSSSVHMTDQLVKAGIAAVGFISDVVNYKIPLKDGSGTDYPAQNHVVSQTRHRVSVKPSSINPVESSDVSNVHEKSSAKTEITTTPSSSYHDAKSKVHSYERVENTQSVSSDRKTYEGTRSEKISHPQKSRSYASQSTAQGSANVHGPRTSGGIPHYTNNRQRELKSQIGVAPFVRHFSNNSHVVENVSNVLRRLKWSPATEATLNSLKLSMDAYQANQVLKQIPDCVVALGFFNWLKSQPGFKHDGHTYTTMVGILGRAKKFNLINVLLDQMVRDGCKPNVVTYNRLIHSYGRANFLNEAVGVFHQMQEVGCEPDRVTYCTLIDIHAKAGFLDVALHMYQNMQEAGLSPDTFTYSVMINCLGKAGHLDSAHKLFCEMINQGCVPNLVTYNIMIALQAKARNYPVALQIYRDMQNAGYEPDTVTYSIVMEVLGHCGYLEEVEVVFSEMNSKGWVPDEHVYGLLVDLWGKSGNAEKALHWYLSMLKAGLCPNIPTCNSLLSAFLRAHRFSDAYNLLQDMVQMGLKPSLQTYTLLLSYCTDAKSSFDMGFCGQLMAITGHPAHMFLLTMPSAGPDGKNIRDHAGRFFDLMHSEDRESKRGLVDAVVDFLHKSGLKEEAGSVWEVAAVKNVYPDAVKEKSSCYWLINLHVMSDGTAVTALSRTLASFRRQLLVSGVGPSRIDIVTGWGRRSRVTGSSLVRQAVQELLNLFSFPFFTENGNSGCFVGCGEPLNRWLQQPCVERMHLL